MDINILFALQEFRNGAGEFLAEFLSKILSKAWNKSYSELSDIFKKYDVLS